MKDFRQNDLMMWSFSPTSFHPDYEKQRRQAEQYFIKLIRFSLETASITSSLFPRLASIFYDLTFHVVIP